MSLDGWLLLNSLRRTGVHKGYHFMPPETSSNHENNSVLREINNSIKDAEKNGFNVTYLPLGGHLVVMPSRLTYESSTGKYAASRCAAKLRKYTVAKRRHDTENAKLTPRAPSRKQDETKTTRQSRDAIKSPVDVRCVQ